MTSNIIYKIYTGEFNDPVSIRTDNKFNNLTVDEYHEYIQDNFCDSVYDSKNHVKCIYPSSNKSKHGLIDYSSIADYKTYMITNYNCINCFMCDNCRNCVGCIKCQNCKNCKNVRSCKFCVDCIDSHNCDHCRDCQLCGTCVGIQHCTGLINTTLFSQYLSDYCKVKVKKII